MASKLLIDGLVPAVLKRLAPEGRPHTTRHIIALRRAGVRTYNDLIEKLPRLRKSERGTAVWLLGRVNRRSGVPVLLQVLVDDRVQSIRWDAAVSLSLLGGQRAIRGLLALARDHTNDDDIRAAATHALAMSYEESALDFFVRTFADSAEHTEVRVQAAEGIAAVLGHCDRRTRRWRRAADVLLPLLSDQEVEIRFWAVFAAGSLRVTKARRRLRALTRDRGRASMGWSVAEEAKDALHCIQHGTWPETDAFARTRGSDNPATRRSTSQ